MHVGLWNFPYLIQFHVNTISKNLFMLHSFQSFWNEIIYPVYVINLFLFKLHSKIILFPEE